MRMISWPIAVIPEIRLAGRFDLGDKAFATTYRGQSHALHLHNYAARMRLGGSLIELAPGDVTLSPAFGESAYDLAAPGSHWCIHFAPVPPETVPAIKLPLHMRLGPASAPIREAMAHIARVRAHADESGIGPAVAALALQQLILSLAERATPQPASSFVTDAADIINERFAEPLTVPAIAREVGRSQAHLARAFRERFGITIPHRLLERRVEHARYLLQSTDLPIWRIAERVGIPDAHHFNKTVRRFLGQSPTAVRRRSGSAVLIDPDR